VTIAARPRSAVNEADAARQLEELLRDSVRRQMTSDVPLGAFLSGGIDSSLIVALMQEQSAKPVQTFTIRFENPEFNEADHARAVADYLGTDHFEETCSAAQTSCFSATSDTGTTRRAGLRSLRRECHTVPWRRY
jgi:asparagine synthetase B (glutamine-hydrolysing)